VIGKRKIGGWGNWENEDKELGDSEIRRQTVYFDSRFDNYTGLIP
jgi:hypothetical protein